MAAVSKAERLTSLVIVLLSTDRYLSAAELREMVEGYHGLSDEAFNRSFERDKDDLRAIGVPIEVGSNDPASEERSGYRIPRSSYELPPLSFSPDEELVLALAGEVWQSSAMAEATQLALAKLQAIGVAPSGAQFGEIASHVSVNEAAFEVLAQATAARQVVEFTYQKPARTQTGTKRRVQPWRLAMRYSAWYLIGLDEHSHAARTFKLSRIADVPQLVGTPGAFEVPTGVELDQQVARVTRQDYSATATLAIADGRADDLRRSGELVDWAGPLPDGYRAWQVNCGDFDSFASFLAMRAPDAFPLEPPALVAAEREHLQRFVAGAR